MEMGCSLLVLGVTLLYGFAQVGGAKWSYEGHAGPKNWHSLFPEACSGESQSPIDLRSEQTIYNPELKDFAIWYDPPRPGSKFYIKNNGHALQVDLVGEFYVTNGGLAHVYRAAQFHFHWGHKNHHGSEHTMDGVASPIEMHLVTWNQDKFLSLGEAATEKEGLAVLGVMFEISEEDNPAFEYIVKGIKHVRDPEGKQRIELPTLSIRNLLPQDISRYYRYNGSLTTPNCFESVTWTVFDQKQTISHRQLKEFRSLLQFRHKHHKDHHSGSERHRRSLTAEERRKEKNAQELLKELGIQDDLFEEEVLRSKLIEKAARDRMMADMPIDSDPEVKTDENHVQGNNAAETHGDKANHGEAVVPIATEEVVEYVYKQNILVNNFRPVQALNSRKVERSFKLRDPPYWVVEESHDAGKADIRSASIKGNDCDSAVSTTASMVAIFFASLVAILLH